MGERHDPSVQESTNKQDIRAKEGIDDSAVVLICMSTRYLKSQACRFEAEYALQERKVIIPVLMERGFKASGWLGALIGTRLYFDMSETCKIQANSAALFKELNTHGT